MARQPISQVRRCRSAFTLIEVLIALAILAVVVSAVSLVGPAVYIWGRSILKAEQTHATDVLPDAWEQRLSDILDVVERLTQGLAKKE